VRAFLRPEIDMSMNLCFDVVGGGHVEFPYQTSTDLTYAVLDAKTVPEQLLLINADLTKRGYEGTDLTEKLTYIGKLLGNTNLELGMI
jgi:hypothetical protein